MATQTEISQYINDHFVVQDPALEQTLEDTPKKGLPAISIRPEEGRFLQVLVRACGATRALEIGTLGGYSGIWIARGLAPGGRLITLEKEPYHAQVAQAHFDLAEVAGRIEIRVGDAHQTLEKLAKEEPFDFVFIDAEKDGYLDYLDWAVEHTRIGGVITAHNALRGGDVLDSHSRDERTQAIQAFNKKVAHHPRFLSTIYPAGDGTVVAVKIS